MKTPSVFCLIPARGGSKRLPGKNLINLKGKPLIAHTIKAAMQSGIFDDVYVSSDSPEILKVAEEYGAEPLIRPAEFSTDHVMIPALCMHVLDSLKEQGKTYDYFALLQPTSPLRNSNDVREAFALLMKQNAETLVTVSPFIQPIQRAVRIGDGVVKPFFTVEQMEKGEQDYEPIYSCHGAICMAKCDTFLEKQSFLLETTIPYILPSERALDINDAYEMAWAEFLLSHKEFSQKT